MKITEQESMYPFDFLLDGLRFDDDDFETVMAYRHAVAHLNMIYESPKPRTILRFPALVSRRFMALLKAEDPRTLTIVGYFFMLLKEFGGLWWIAGHASAEFKALMELIPDQWRPKMDLAVRLINQEHNQRDLGCDMVNV